MKSIRRYIALALMMVMCFCMIGCGEKDAFYGKWAYSHDTEKMIAQFKTGGKVTYKGTEYSYVENNGVLEMTSANETLNYKYMWDGDVLYIYEPMTYYYQGEGEADGLVGYWLAENGRSNYEFTAQGTFREDSYIPGYYSVNEENHSIKCVYNDQYFDTVIYYTLDGNTLVVEYPWPMVKMK
ncbi:MAG: hypothetical protein MJ104_07625 [Lachnospiraceae bacterium]|nr:hypothetical protein [Lachnospiraceae bacterium]